MDITNKMLMDLANEVGLKDGGQLSAREIEGMQKKAENIQGKGEAEILAEIMALKEAIKKIANPTTNKWRPSAPCVR